MTRLFVSTDCIARDTTCLHVGNSCRTRVLPLRFASSWCHCSDPHAYVFFLRHHCVLHAMPSHALYHVTAETKTSLSGRFEVSTYWDIWTREYVRNDYKYGCWRHDRFWWLLEVLNLLKCSIRRFIRSGI